MRARFGPAMCAHFGLAKPSGWTRFGGRFGLGFGAPIWVLFGCTLAPVWFGYRYSQLGLHEMAMVQLFDEQGVGREEHGRRDSSTEEQTDICRQRNIRVRNCTRHVW